MKSSEGGTVVGTDLCWQCDQEQCQVSEMREHLDAIFKQCHPKPDRFSNVAYEILAACLDFGIKGVVLHFPHQRIEASFDQTPLTARYRVLLGPWNEGALELLTESGDAIRDEGPCEFALSTEAQLGLHWLMASYTAPYLPSRQTELPLSVPSTGLWDALTDTLNREGLLSALDEAILNVQNGRPFALHLFDVDDFKRINDTLGHQMGDKVLVQVARAVSRQLRSTDVLARFGGDEFCVIQSDVRTPEQVAAVSAAIGGAVANIETIDEVWVHTTVSVGSCLITDPRTTAKAALTQADMAMYRVKHRGKNAICLFDKILGATLQRQFDVEHALRAPSFRSELYTVFQPIYCLQTDNLVRAEALTRWKRAKDFQITTEDIIEISRKRSSYDILQAQVIDAVLEQVRYALDHDLAAVPISINVCPTELVDTQWQDTLLRKIHQAGVPPEMIELEITEQRQLLLDTASIKRIAHLSDKGIALSLDDFGAGYASFGSLDGLDLQEIKIDRSLTKSIASDAKKRKIVTGVCKLAHELGLKTVAEGVETQEQLSALSDAGCDYGQGYYLARPMGQSAFRQLLSEQKGDG
jgi:diguanylate cyclase (GGDEF)-like protein